MFSYLNFRFIIFICASLLGVFFALMCRRYEHQQRQFHRQKSIPALHDTSRLYESWLISQGLKFHSVSEEEIHYNPGKLKTEAGYLYKSVPVMCVVWSRKKTQAVAVKDTWSRNCNKLIFWGDYYDAKIPVLQVTSNGILRAIFLHIWKKYKNEFRWLLLANDNTFAVIENLRHYVAPLDSSKPYYLGHPVQHYSTNYNLADAGILLSHGAVWSVYETLVLLNSSFRFPLSINYDEELGFILKSCNVSVMDTRDAELKSRFNPFSPEKMIVPGSISIFDSYWRSSLFLSNEGKDCCSDQAITFNGVTVAQMHLLEYLVHSLSIFMSSPKGLANHKPPAIKWDRKPPPLPSTGKPSVFFLPPFKNRL